MNQHCRLWLTCKDRTEASKIAKALLDKKLVACAKQIKTNSQFHWQGKIQSENEVLLLMESHEDLFEEIEKEVAKLHSYDTFVLTASPTTQVSEKAKDWLNENLQS